MAATNDTIDGLLAEFRGYSAGMPASYHVTMSWADFRKMLDRFDAAHKRDCAKIEADALAVGGIVGATYAKSSAVGDAAKLREACAKAAESAAEIMERVRHKDGLAFNTANYIAGIAKDALAASPRNCDLARDWLNDLYVHFKPPASVRREMPPEWVDAVMAFCRWLVAPATKGGNDADK